ncbi:hypothetical protein BSKO_03424 [Bryopsis sp. KO-2023]|nr:hypothetical protein BSKO_03424 [Bryopsis sp. KO-2023]
MSRITADRSVCPNEESVESDLHASGGIQHEQFGGDDHRKKREGGQKGERDALIALADIGRPEEEDDDEMDGTNLAMIQNAMAKLIQTKKDTAKQKENELLQVSAISLAVVFGLEPLSMHKAGGGQELLCCVLFAKEIVDKFQDNCKKLDQHMKRECMALAKTWRHVSDSLKEKLEETDNRAEHLKARAEAEISQVLEELNEVQNQAVELNESLQVAIQDKCRNLKRKIGQAREEAFATIAEAESKLKKSKLQANKLPGLKRVLQDLC